MTTLRLTPARLAALRDQLSPRDELILVTLRRLRVLTARHIEALVFTQNTPLSNARMSRRAMGKLVDLGLATRLERRRGGARAGSAGDVFSLSAAGVRLTDPPDRPQRAARAPWTTSRAFLDHHLQVSDLYVALVQGERRDEGELLDFVTEPAAWRRYLDPAGALAVLKPDAFVVIGVGDYEHRWFIEVDRGTEGPKALARKLRAFVDYWRGGSEVNKFGVHPRTVFVVPDERRHGQIINLLAKLPAEAWPLFAVVMADGAATRLLAGEVAP